MVNVLMYVSKSVEIITKKGLKEFFFTVIIFIENKQPICINSRLLYVRHKLSNSAGVPSPYKLINIDPNDVNYLLSPRFEARRINEGTYIESGGWDKRYSDEKLYYTNDYEGIFQKPHLVHFDNYIFYESICRHFHKGLEWEQTKIYDWFVDNLDDQSIERYNSVEKIDQRLNWLDELYDEIEKCGYKKQSELKRKKLLGKPPEYNEIRINIGREGEIIFDDGRHRFMIAKALRLDSIPVRVLVRHKEWQKLRSEVAKADNPKELSEKAKKHLSHPDMKTVINFK